MPSAAPFSIPNEENPSWLGVDLSRSPDALEDGFLAWAQNTWQPELTHLALRPQTRLVGSNNNGVTAAGNDPLSLITFRDHRGFARIVLWKYQTSVVESNYLEFFNNGNVSEITMEDGSRPWVPPEQIRSGRPSWVAWNGKLYVFAGHHAPGWVFSATKPGDPLYYPGYVLAASVLGTSWPSGDQPRARVAWLYRNTFVLSGFDPPEGSTIRNCGVNDPESLISSSKAFYVGRGDGDDILAGIEVPVFGGSTYVEPYSLVFKRNSVWMLQGQLPTSGSDGTLSVSRVVEKEGIISKDSLVMSEYGPIWCSGQNVWLAPFGGTPIKIGNRVSSYLKTKAQGVAYAWCAAYANGIYRLSVPSLSMCISGNMPGYEQWWCDLRQFPEIRWWGPMSLPAGAMVTDVGDPSRARVLSAYPTENGIYLVEGDIHQEDPDYADAHSTLSEQSNPTMEVRTKKFTFGSRHLDKMMLALETSLWSDRSGYFTLGVVVDGQTLTPFSTPGGISNQVTYTASGFVLGTGALDTAGVGDHGHSAIPAYPASGRVRGKALQVVLTSLSSAPYLEIASLGGRFTVIGRRP